jgi:hypothetical protein
MPRTNFGPEVKSAMQGGGAPRPPKSPGAQVAEQGRDSSGNTGLPPPNKLPGPGRGGMPGMGGGGLKPPGAMPSSVAGALPGGMSAPDAHHIAAAAGIAHAILGNRGLR